MEFFKPGVRYDFLRLGRSTGIVSMVLVVVSWALVFTKGLNFGIDFAGGTEALVAFNQPVDVGEIRSAAEEIGLEKAEAVSYGLGDSGKYLVRSQTQSLLTTEQIEKARAAVEQKLGAPARFESKDETGEKILVQFDGPKDPAAIQAAVAEAGMKEATVSVQSHGAAPVYTIRLGGLRHQLAEQMKARFGDKFQAIERLESVGSAVGRELQEQGALAVLYAMIGIVLYIIFRFDARYAPGGAIGLLHDVSITIGIYALFGLDFDLPIVAALLAIVGYSINDKVVVYDRMRENLQLGVGKDLYDTINISISETLGRTINVSLTMFLSTVSIFIFCAGTVQNFAFAMMVGVVVATYSSIWVATPTVLFFDRYFAARRAATDTKGGTSGTGSARASRP